MEKTLGKIDPTKTVKLGKSQAEEYSRWATYGNQRVESPSFVPEGGPVSKPIWLDKSTFKQED